MRKCVLLSVLCFVILSFTFLFVPSTEAALSWNAQRVYEDVWAGGNCPLAIDSKSTAHVIYPAAHYDGVDMIYASYNGSMWTNQTVETGNSGFKKPIDLALDTHDYPHLLYVYHPFGLPAVASWNGRNWDIKVIGTIYASEASLALDPVGNPYVAYTTGVKLRYEYGSDWIGSALKYASWSGNDWNIQTIGSDMNNTFKRVSLALDKDHTPYILYSLSSESSSAIKLAKYQNSDWRIQDAQLPPSIDNIGNIVVDSTNQAHFICTQPKQDSTILNTILYVTFTGTEWNTQAVAAEVQSGTIGKLVLDPQDNPYFTYSNFAGETIYATYSGSNWKLQTLPSDVEAGDLALDQNGNPHLSYRTYSPKRYITNLMYANATEAASPDVLHVPDYAILAVVSVVVVVVLVVVAGAFVWKKKTRLRNIA